MEFLYAEAMHFNTIHDANLLKLQSFSFIINSRNISILLYLLSAFLVLTISCGQITAAVLQTVVGFNILYMRLEWKKIKIEYLR